MKILIIEDEAQAAWNLQQTIVSVVPTAEILGIVDCVAGIEEWFAQHDAPDLIFSDIQLGDGTVFEAYKKITIPCPIIFCTAYDEYLLQALKTNGVDYLLKPIDEKELKRSFDKLAIIQKPFSDARQQAMLNKALLEILNNKSSYKSNFLIPHRDRLIPVETGQIAYFKVNDAKAEIMLLNGKNFFHHYTLDYLESVLNPALFYRASRQHLLSFEAIHEIEQYDDRKLMVHLKEPNNEKIVVSKAKASDFLQWVQKR